MSINTEVKNNFLKLPDDVLGVMATYCPKKIFLIASASQKNSLKESAFREAYRVRHVWISEWERKQSQEDLIDRDLFYKKLSSRNYVNADKGFLTPSFYPPDLSRYSFYEIHSKKPQEDLRRFENLERAKVSSIFKQLDNPSNQEEGRLFSDRVRLLDHQMRELHQKVKHTNETIELTASIPTLFKIVFVIYDFFKSFFTVPQKTSGLFPIERPGFSLRRGTIGFHTYFPGNHSE